MVNSSTSSSRRKFFLKLIVFLVVVAVLDAGLGGLLRHFYFTQKSGLNQRTTYAVEESRDSIIVLGSSRAQAHYVPSILESGLGGSCFNAGRNGQSLLYAGAVYQAILSREAPKVVFLDLILTDFFKYHGHYDRLSALLPYYQENEAVRPFVRLRSPMEPLKLMSRIYPFNSLPLQIIKYNLLKSGNDKGFVAQLGTVQGPIGPLREKAWVRNGLDDQVIDAFNHIVTSCLENEIDLYVIISPVFDGKAFGRDAIEEIESLLVGTPYSLWDFSDHEDYLENPALFRDRGHLNIVGAEAFSSMVVDRVLGEAKLEVSDLSNKMPAK